MGSPTLIGVPSPQRPRTFRIATRAATREEFVESFWRFVDEASIFLVIREPPVVGRQHPFRITLLDGAPVMVGEGEIVESVTDGGGAFRKNGMRMKFLRIDEATRTMHRELLSRRLASTPHPRPITNVPLPDDAADAPASVPASTSQPVRVPVRPPPMPRVEATPPPERAPSASEIRTPGSTYTLPANPFSELPDQALEHFVECVLYEDSAVFPIEQASAFIPVGGAPEVPMRAGTPLPVEPIVPAPPVLPPGFTPVVSSLAPGSPASPPLLGPAPGEPWTATSLPPASTFNIAALSPPSDRPPTAPFPLPAPSPSGQMAVARPSAPMNDGMPEGWGTDDLPAVTGDEYAPASTRRKPWMILAAASAVTLVLGLGIGYALWGGDAQPAAAAAAMPASSIPRAAVPPEAQPGATPPAAPVAPTPVDPRTPVSAGTPGSAPGPASDDPPAADPPAKVAEPGTAVQPATESGGCIASIITTPPGARAAMGAVALGVTPVRNASVPCTGTLVLEHPRYERVQRQVAWTPGTPGLVEQGLVRPDALLTLTSSPPGATLTVNGQVVGKTPFTVKVPAYTGASIAMVLAGHKPWALKHYVKGRRAKLNAPLEALPKPKPIKKPTRPTKPATKPAKRPAG